MREPAVQPHVDAIPGPEYGAFYFRHDCGVPYERNDHWLGFFDEVAEAIVRTLHPTSVLDVGCAMGFLVEALVKRGVDARGVDVSEYAISQVDDSVADRCRVGSATDPIDRRYDLVTCIEVLEHLPPSESDRALANLCSATDRVLVSTTPADFSEASHLNVRPPEAWAADFAREGLLRNLDLDFSVLTPWASLFAREDQPLPEIVRRYDGAWSRLRTEVGELRRALLAGQRRLAELEADAGFDRRPEALAELDRLKEENLRLRDLLVGKDAELGSARGQLAVHEDHSRRLTNAMSRVQGRIPGVMRIGGAALRRLQGRRD